MQIGGAKETKAVSTDSVVSHQYNCIPIVNLDLYFISLYKVL